MSTALCLGLDGPALPAPRGLWSCLPSCAVLDVSLHHPIFGLKALVLSWVTWLHLLSFCGVSGLYGFSLRTCVSVFVPCLLGSRVWVMMSQSHG